jgi:DNA-binding GntR family transcriptional regulator
MRHSKLDSLVPGPTLIAQAYDAILGAICDGRLAPGARLHQDLLAERLRISRQPIGQALSILRAQGFVRDTGRRSVIVAPLERDFFRALYQIREALDPMATQCAARRCSQGDVAEGRKILARGRHAVASGTLADLIAADMEFHMWTYRLAGNPVLVETMVVYWNHLRRAMGEVLRRRSRGRRIWDEHARILEAIAARDANGAGRRALAHVRDAAERVAGSLPAGRAGADADPGTIPHHRAPGAGTNHRAASRRRDF